MKGRCPGHSALHAGQQSRRGVIGDATKQIWPSEHLTAFFIVGVKGHRPEHDAFPGMTTTVTNFGEQGRLIILIKRKGS